MGIFGGLKDRFMGRKESFDDIRSYVVGAAQAEQPRLGSQPPRQQFRQPAFDENEDIGPPMKSYDEAREPLSFDEPAEPPFGLRKPPTTGEKPSYDILDRLNVIEAQLSAIRSQTETINERLKNLEVKLTGRRLY